MLIVLVYFIIAEQDHLVILLQLPLRILDFSFYGLIQLIFEILCLNNVNIILKILFNFVLIIKIVHLFQVFKYNNFWVIEYFTFLINVLINLDC